MIRKSPGDNILHLELGKINMEFALSGLFEGESKKKELKKAEFELQKSLELRPGQVKPNYLLGRIYFLCGDFNRAIEHFENVLKIRPDDFRAILGLGECFWEKNNPRNFRLYLQKIKSHADAYEGEEREQVLDLLEFWNSGNPKAERKRIPPVENPKE